MWRKRGDAQGPLLEAIGKRVTWLLVAPLCHREPELGISPHRREDTEQEVIFAHMLTWIAIGGYIWHQAERDVGVILDPKVLEHVEFGVKAGSSS